MVVSGDSGEFVKILHTFPSNQHVPLHLVTLVSCERRDRFEFDALRFTAVRKGDGFSAYPSWPLILDLLFF